jgi:DNA repair exonuclease SbcCD ATPase subunit
MCILFSAGDEPKESMITGSADMATRPLKKPKTPDLDESIQIALDAADASMDVTAEFERISSQFSETAESTARLAKASGIALASGVGVAVLAVIIMGFVWQRSSSGLERLTATNTELLTILAENVDELGSGIQTVVDLSQKIDDANALMVEMRTELDGLTVALAQVEDIQVQLTQMSEGLAQIETVDMATERTEAQTAALGDRIGTLNGELAMNVSTNLRDALAEQTGEYREVISDLSEAMATAPAGGLDPSAISELEASIESRLNGLNMRLNQITKSVSQAPRQRKQPSPTADVIKFP